MNLFNQRELHWVWWFFNFERELNHWASCWFQQSHFEFLWLLVWRHFVFEPSQLNTFVNHKLADHFADDLNSLKTNVKHTEYFTDDYFVSLKLKIWLTDRLLLSTWKMLFYKSKSFLKIRLAEVIWEKGPKVRFESNKFLLI